MNHDKESCPVCGQSMPYRNGVRLTAIKARIFDVIESRPGITLREINHIVFSGQVTESTVKSHIHAINQLFESTDIAIRGVSGSGYRTQSRRAARAA